ncbi:MAG: putative quinol monooxygenase [Dehalococcoidia bacterium]
MVIITGHATAGPDSIDELLAISLEHVHRSRTEPGCLSHAVHIDAENPLRLVFLETWSDREAVAAHFAVPASRAFVMAARRLTVELSAIELYEARSIEM